MGLRVSLRDRVVAITGAGGGIGGALAKAFAARGARLALLDLPGRGHELAASLAGEGCDVLELSCDVTREDDCRSAFEAVEARFGGVDVLVNNAGITHLGSFAETDVAVLRRVMEVNFFGAVHCTKAAWPSLSERRGAVVVLSSVAGFAPLAGRAGYAASKHALHGLFESARTEWRRVGVRLLMVCPAFVDTGIGEHALGPDGGSARTPRTTAGRPASPEQVARAIVRGLERGRRRLVLSPLGKASWWLSRLWPAAYERRMARALLADEAEAPRPR